MIRQFQTQYYLVLTLSFLLISLPSKEKERPEPQKEFDVVVLMATPGGIAAAISASRLGMKVVLIERTNHIGGLPAIGLGETDIQSRDLASGIFKEFIDEIKRYYSKKYGVESQQFKDASDGFHFEPHVAEKVFTSILKKEKNIEILKEYQFDSHISNVEFQNNLPEKIKISKANNSKKSVWIKGKVFIDASYEGDLAAAFGCRFRTKKESKSDFGEPMEGKIYKIWGNDSLETGSTGERDSSIQAYNYKLCLTNDPEKKKKISKPQSYNRYEYQILLDDIRSGIVTGFLPKNDKTAGIFNLVKLPNKKFDANSHHRALVSSELPEESWPYPNSDWNWRDAFARRFQSYTLGLIYFVQNDSAVPLSFRKEALEFGFANDEYRDNDYFPRQINVGEGRRIEGKYIFTAHDALPEKPNGRPPIHKFSIGTSHYPIESHAMQKRKADKKTLDGLISHQTKPFTIPFQVMVPLQIDNVLTPVPVSASYVGYSCLRMEPCWVILGQAAGVAAAISIKAGTSIHKISIDSLQWNLINQKVNLIYYNDVRPEDPNYEFVQKIGLLGWIPEYSARLNEPFKKEDIRFLSGKSGYSIQEIESLVKNKTRLEGLVLLFKEWKKDFSKKKS